MLPATRWEAVNKGFHFIKRSKAGIDWFMRINDDGSRDFAAYSDVQPILDQNVAMQNHNDGWSVEGNGKSEKLLRRAASVPWALIHKWRAEEGIDWFNEDDQKKINQRLNSIEFRKLRTAEFKL